MMHTFPALPVQYWSRSLAFKKNRVNTEQAKPARPTQRDLPCQTVLQKSGTRPSRLTAMPAAGLTHEKRGFSERLWISHLISTGWLVRKHEVMQRRPFYTILLLCRYTVYAGFFFRVNDWSCWKKSTYPQKNPRLLLLLFLYIDLL